MSKQATHRSMRDDGLNKLVREIFVWASIAIVLSFLIFRNKTTARDVAEQIKLSETRLQELRSTEQQWQDKHARVEQDESAIVDFLFQCQSVDDLPDFSGAEHVIAYGNQNQLLIHIPSGEHQLEIRATYQRRSTDPGDPTQDQPAEQSNWIVPLKASTGYLLELMTDASPQRVAWKLSAKDREFPVRSEIVLQEDFSNTAVGVDRSDPLQYPNQVQAEFEANTDRARQWEEWAKVSPGLKLHQVRRETPDRGQYAWVEFSVWLYSEGPPTVSAVDAVEIIKLDREDLLSTYRGGGKYQLRKPN